MRIAYCFAGYLRTFNHHQTLLANLINHYPGDVFVHTWDKLNYGKTDTWHRDTSGFDLKVTRADLDWIYKHYQPISMIIENDESFPHQNSFYSPMPMAKYGIYKSVELKRKYEQENGFVYDWVFILRFDLLLLKKFEMPKDNSILYYKYCDWRKDHPRHMMDILNFSSSQNIDKMAELYQFILSNEQERWKFSPEEFLYEWIDRNKISIAPIMNSCCGILRFNKDIHYI